MVERWARVAGPAAVTLFALIGVALAGRPTVLTVLGAGVAVVAAAILALCSITGWLLAGGLAVAAAGITMGCSGDPANLGWFGLCVLAGWCALRAPTTQTVVLAAGLVLVLVVQWLAVSNEPGWGAWIAGTVFATVICGLGRRQRELLEQLVAAQAGLAERARAEERTHIAREMHDVLGHALTVSLLHVTSARLALDEDPAEARAALAEAERLSRQSLAEVRQSVGMLRVEGPGGASPMPDAGQVEELVQSFRRAGTSVTLEVVGVRTRLTATEGLTVYRIIQEALTNVVRHAPAASATVRLSVSAEQTVLSIDDDGVGCLPARHGVRDGVGLLSMRERAEALGGRLTAGPVAHGWRVEAVLPGHAVGAVRPVPAATRTPGRPA